MKNNISKDFVIEMMKKVDDTDKKFLLQIYTIIKRSFGQKGEYVSLLFLLGFLIAAR